MLSRISNSQIASTALRRIVPYGVFSWQGHPFPRSRMLLLTHQSSYQHGIKPFSTSRPWFKKQRKGDIVGRLLSASGLLSREQEKAIEDVEGLYDRMGMAGYIPFVKGLAVILFVITLVLPVWLGVTCVRWTLRKVRVLQHPQVAKEVENYGAMNDDDQYWEGE